MITDMFCNISIELCTLVLLIVIQVSASVSSPLSRDVVPYISSKKYP